MGPKQATWKNSNDKPEPLVPRHYVVMEVKENLTKDDRVKNLKRFNHPSYKKVPNVVMGEPDGDFKKVVHARILKEKKEKAAQEWKSKKQEKERKKQLEERQKQLAQMRKKAEEQRKKAEAEKKKKAEEKKKKEEEEKKKKEAEEAKKK